MGHPGELVNKKVIHRLDKHCINFLALSPLLFLSTSDKEGNCDVSPRGDPAGFVLVLDDLHLVIPERPGNRRVDSIINILENPKIGLLFIIPTLGETLRINGHAFIVKDEEILNKLSVQGKQPVIAIGVRVEECFIHCAKAFKRSGAWESSSWPQKDALPSPSTILSEHINSVDYTEESISKVLDESYKTRLY